VESDSGQQTLLYEELSAIVAPFYAAWADEFDLTRQLPVDYHFTRTLGHLTGYYVALVSHYDRIRLMDRDKMRAFLLVTLEHYGVVKMDEIEDKTSVLNALFHQ
jgi:hypothetical protein